MSRNNYIAKISMPLLEWVCVAAIPLFLCNNIVRRRAEELEDIMFHDDTFLVQKKLQPILQSTLITLVVTALLSLMSISSSSLTNKGKRNQNLRGEGIVVGSHLIPIMYYALYLLYCQKGDSIQYSNSGLQHVTYSSCGGLAFVISHFWLQRNANEYVTSENSRAMVKLCWKVYLALLLSHQVFSMIDDGTFLDDGTVFGLLHILMIVVYSTANCKTRRDENQWQDAFTCGEWMVVSNLTASLIGDFILHRSYSFLYDDYPDQFPAYARVAQAGLVGCFVGVVYCQATSRIFHQGVIGSLAGVIGIVIGFLEMTLTPSSISQKVWIPLIPRRFVEMMGSTSQEVWLIPIPRSILWLLQFLSNEVTMEVGGSVMHFHRYEILGYWSFVLIASIPLTVKVCKWVEAGGSLSWRRVVVARKFFHLVAVILFTPITWIDSEMMALSYAIATTLLMILEIIRCYSFGQESGNMTLSLNAFYAIFLDEKDSLAANGGLTITHITLIVGCAMPLVLSQIVNATDDGSFILRLLPYVGVIVLGIGDSAGAVAGVTFGRHQWPGGSSRTLEGSLSMFISMLTALCLAGFDDFFTAGTFLAIMTLLEASTTQIDNLCLPVAGTSLAALLAAIDVSNR